MSSRLVPVSVSAIPVGVPLQFALRAHNGVLLAAKGYVIASHDELERFHTRGLGLAIDIQESDVALRAYLVRLNSMIYQDATIAEIAQARIEAIPNLANSGATVYGGYPDFLVYLDRLQHILTEPAAKTFRLKIDALQRDLTYFLLRQPDASLTAVVQLACRETKHYSAMHALLVWVVVSMTARFALRWEDVVLESLGKAALTMNISMTQMQDELMAQRGPLSHEQKRVVDTHHELSKGKLLSLGVDDSLWLDAVLHHKDCAPGPLADKPLVQQMGRLLQRADVMGARLAPRLYRRALSSTAALQASYLDELQQPDDAGTAIVRTLGVYVPGSYVRLASEEIAIVVRRRLARPGAMGTAPHVVVLVNREGYPAVAHIERDTSYKQYSIVGPVLAEDIKVAVPLEKLLRAASAKRAAGR